MSRFFFLCITIFICQSGSSQSKIVLNELYPDPDPTVATGNKVAQHEYVELYNTSEEPVPLGCYTLISYDNNNKLAWVYQLPDITLAPFSHIVFTSSTEGSPVLIRFGDGNNTTTYAGSNVISWNVTRPDASLRSYTRSATPDALGNYTLTQGSQTTTLDFMPIAQGNSASTALFLFKGSTLESGLVTNNGGNLPADFTTLNSLSLALGTTCGNALFNFRNITENATEIPSNLNQAPGRNNGFYRIRDGVCGSWDKMEKGYTPGATNSTAPPPSTSVSIDVSSTTQCRFPSATTSTWNLTITVSDEALLNATFKSYVDENNTGVINVGDDPVVSGSITSTSPLTVPSFAAMYGKSILTQIITVAGCIQVVDAQTDPCIVLPVSLSSFAANRNPTNRQEIDVTWTTAQEQHNRGFELQRKTGGEWQSIAFVPAAGAGGNSSHELRYRYKDQNNFPGVSQYRLLQIDIDDRKSFSKEVAVRGISQAAAMVVYPNPGVNGSVNLLFSEAASTREVLVNDLSGRLVKRYRNISGNTLTVGGLAPGFYTVRVMDAGTGATTIEKVVIK